MGNLQSTPLGPLIERWNALPQTRQMMLGGLAALAVVAFYFIFISSSQPKMVVAFSGLAPQDTASIADELESSRIPYEIRSGGSAVAVPANKVAEVRIRLASAGLPTGGSIGLEIFDQTNFGATDFVQQVNFRRGLEGELARSINTLTGVQASRVHISIPENAIFVEDQVDPTASVLLQLKPGVRLNEDQVRGITNLVTNAVEGLEAKGVTIIDDSGRVLYDGRVTEGMFSTGGTATQMDLQRQYELSLQRDVTETLARVVGPGKSAVTVRAQLNFDQVTQAEQQFGTQDQAVPRSQTTTEETFVGSNLTVGAVPGTDGNTGAGNAAGTGNGNSEYSRTETTTNWEIPQVSSTTVKAPGSVQRLSVSVVLDESITAAQEASITSAVAAAVGLDQTRGDQLSVTRLPFDESVVNDLVGVAGDGLETYLSYLKLLLPFLAIVLGFILVMLLLRSLSKRQFAFMPAPLQPQLAAGPNPAAIALAALPLVEQLPELEQASDPHEERVLKLAEANPRAVADVVQTWMREE
ncbi:MAG TPA: flagellar basal-body MS-ring/collar protein FliF [Tepidiformaceae bacterium]|nr:flagellar basal-body MS-ring/collar protein FliF [Tepidiformaceae bacterium]